MLTINKAEPQVCLPEHRREYMAEYSGKCVTIGGPQDGVRLVVVFRRS